MSDRSKKSGQRNFLDIFNATSSLELESGPMPLTGQAGPPIKESGPDPAPANLSPMQDSKKDLKITDTSGPSGIDSSPLAVHPLSLENKLAARESSAKLTNLLRERIKLRTDQLGSTLFRLTWKTQVTPSGRLIPRLRATAHRTSDKDSTLLRSWSTPTATIPTTRRERADNFNL